MRGRGYIFLLISLLSSRKSDTHRTLPSFFGMMNVGAAHSEAPIFESTPSSTKWSNSFWKTSKWAWATGNGRLWTGCAFSTSSRCSLRCGYRPNLPLKSLVYLLKRVAKSFLWLGVRCVWDWATSWTLTFWYFDSKILTAFASLWRALLIASFGLMSSRKSV